MADYYKDCVLQMRFSLECVFVGIIWLTYFINALQGEDSREGLVTDLWEPPASYNYRYVSIIIMIIP